MFDKGSKERQMFADFYRICEKNWDLKDPEQLIADADMFRSQYEDGSCFAAYLAMGLMERLKKNVKSR